MPIPEVVQMQAFADTKDAFGAFIDRDNATCWLFQFQKGGFARCSMADGSILFQGNIFNDPTKVLAYHGTATPMWAQDANGFYYTMFGSVLYKLALGSGPIIDLGNGYLETIATLDLSAFGPFTVTAWALYKNVMALTVDGLNALVLIDTDLLTLGGLYQPRGGAQIIPAPFFDQGGMVWALAAQGRSVQIINWTPAWGFVGSSLTLKARVAQVDLTRFGWSAPALYSTYCPLQGAVMLTNKVSTYTGEVLVLGLQFKNCIAFHPADATFSYTGAPDAPMEVTLIGQLASRGVVLLGDSGNNEQVGGIYQVISPGDLSSMVNYNVTDDIVNDAGFPVPTAVQPGRGPDPIPTPFACFEYNWTLDRAIITYQSAGSAAYSVKVGGGGGGGFTSLGLMAVRLYCQAYGIFISGVMDTQRPAADWLNELCQVANCAPVWTGSMLNFVPRCEVSAAGNGAIYIAPTASGPVADLDDSSFGYADGPPVTFPRTRQADAYNVLPIEHINRADNYNRAITTIRDDSDIFFRGAIKASTLQLHWIHDQATAVKVGWPLVRRSTLVGRINPTFILQKNYSWLDPYDLVTLTDPIMGITRFPVRLTQIKENSNFELECTSEPFYYGAHAPTATLPGSVPINTSFNQNLPPGSINTPVILEAVARLNSFQNQGSIWLLASGANPNYGGCVVFMSVDGGATYTQVQDAVMNGNGIIGLTIADFPAGTDPDTVDTLTVDISESFGQQLQSFTAAQRDAFSTLVYLQGGGPNVVNGQNLDIPYELLSYETATLISGQQYNITPTTRRGVYGTPIVDHPVGSQFAILDTSIVVQVPLDPSLIGREIFFKFCAFNQFLQEQQDISDPAVIAYPFTPTGKTGGSQIVNQNQNYTTTPAQVVFQGQSGGIPGHPSFTDPTKVYVITPFTVNFASGPVTYVGPFGPSTIPGTTPETIFVSIQDPQLTGSGTLFVDTTDANYNSSGFVKIGKLFINDISTGGASPQTPQRNIYGVTPAPDGSNKVFLIKGFPPGPYADINVNGVLQTPGVHYVLLGNQITFTQAPKANADIEAVF